MPISSSSCRIMNTAIPRLTLTQSFLCIIFFPSVRSARADSRIVLAPAFSLCGTEFGIRHGEWRIFPMNTSNMALSAWTNNRNSIVERPWGWFCSVTSKSVPTPTVTVVQCKLRYVLSVDYISNGKPHLARLSWWAITSSHNKGKRPRPTKILQRNEETKRSAGYWKNGRQNHHATQATRLKRTKQKNKHWDKLKQMVWAIYNYILMWK